MYNTRPQQHIKPIVSSVNKDDCYYFFSSGCQNPNCPYRHAPEAIGSLDVCQLWRQGNCDRSWCRFRHAEVDVAGERDRSKVDCYWEAQATGCKKPNCQYRHQRPKAGLHVPTFTAIAPRVSNLVQINVVTDDEPSIDPRPVPNMMKVEPVIVKLGEESSDQESTTSSPLKAVKPSRQVQDDEQNDDSRQVIHSAGEEKKEPEESAEVADDILQVHAEEDPDLFGGEPAPTTSPDRRVEVISRRRSPSLSPRRRSRTRSRSPYRRRMRSRSRSLSWSRSPSPRYRRSPSPRRWSPPRRRHSPYRPTSPLRMNRYRNRPEREYYVRGRRSPPPPRRDRNRRDIPKKSPEPKEKVDESAVKERLEKINSALQDEGKVLSFEEVVRQKALKSMQARLAAKLGQTVAEEPNKKAEKRKKSPSPPRRKKSPSPKQEVRKPAPRNIRRPQQEKADSTGSEMNKVDGLSLAEIRKRRAERFGVKEKRDDEGQEKTATAKKSETKKTLSQVSPAIKLAARNLNRARVLKQKALASQRKPSQDDATEKQDEDGNQAKTPARRLMLRRLSTSQRQKALLKKHEMEGIKKKKNDDAKEKVEDNEEVESDEEDDGKRQVVVTFTKSLEELKEKETSPVKSPAKKQPQDPTEKKVSSVFSRLQRKIVIQEEEKTKKLPVVEKSKSTLASRRVLVVKDKKSEDESEDLSPVSLISNTLMDKRRKRWGKSDSRASTDSSQSFEDSELKRKRLRRAPLEIYIPPSMKGKESQPKVTETEPVKKDVKSSVASSRGRIADRLGAPVVSSVDVPEPKQPSDKEQTDKDVKIKTLAEILEEKRARRKALYKSETETPPASTNKKEVAPVSEEPSGSRMLSNWMSGARRLKVKSAAAKSQSPPKPAPQNITRQDPLRDQSSKQIPARKSYEDKPVKKTAAPVKATEPPVEEDDLLDYDDDFDLDLSEDVRSPVKETAPSLVTLEQQPVVKEKKSVPPEPAVTKTPTDSTSTENSSKYTPTSKNITTSQDFDDEFDLLLGDDNNYDYHTNTSNVNDDDLMMEIEEMLA